MKKNNVPITSILFISAAISISIGIFWYLSGNSEQRVTGGLSDRTREFLTSQKANTDSLWPDYTFEEGTEQKQYQSVETNCFTLEMPIPVRNLKTSIEQESCLVKATIDTPHAFLTISSEPAPSIHSLSDLSAVKLRTTQPDVYTQEKREELDSPNSIVFSTTTEVVYFYLENETITTVALYDLATINSDTYQLLTKVVKSVGIQ